MECLTVLMKDFNFILYNCKGHTLHWGKVHLMRSSKRADIDQKAVEDQDDGVEDNLAGRFLGHFKNLASICINFDSYLNIEK